MIDADPQKPRTHPLRREADFNTHYTDGGCKTIDELKVQIDKRFEKGTERMDGLETLIKTNNADTTEVLEIVRMGKGFFRGLGLIGTCIKWAVGIAAPVVALWYSVKGGIPK